MHRVLLAILLGFWSVFPWYVARVRDGSDEPLGLLALLLAALAMQKERKCLALHPLGCGLALVCLLLALSASQWLSPMLRALLAVVALGSALAMPARQPGIFLLLLLSLPVIASLQFYAGYPLRVLAAELSSWLLNAAGAEVTRQGTTLLWLGNEIGVDPPCSGVKMLWTCLLVASALAAYHRMQWPRFLLLQLPAALLLAVLGNALRATLLFPFESGMWPGLAGYHTGIGLVVTAVTLYAVLRVHDALRQQPSLKQIAQSSAASLLTHRLATAMLGVALVLAFQQSAPRAAPRVKGEAQWPSDFSGYRLEPLLLSTREQAFAAEFPGHLARFRAGPAELILRQVHQPTRRLHSSRDCLQAAGYKIHPQAHCVDAQGQRWSVCLAEKSGQILQVQERISAMDGTESWTDVSAWFWAALLSPTGGPWLATTYILPQPDAALR